MPRFGASAVSNLLHGTLGSVSWRLVLRDLVGILVWFAVVTLAFRATGLPTWLYTAVVFGGVLAYSLRAESWTT